MTKLTIDIITYRKVAIAKQIYDKALLQSFIVYNPVNAILSVIGFDLAVETLVKTLVVFLGIVKVEDLKNFKIDNLLTKTEDYLTTEKLESLPDKTGILRVRKIRNSAMHEAKIPSVSDVDDSRTWSKDFLDEIVLRVWDKSFDLISITDFIQNEVVKNLLIDAEKEYEDKNWKKSILQAATGLSLILKPLKISLDSPSQKFYQDSVLHVTSAVRNLQEMLLLNALGIDFAGYVKFQEISGNVHRLNDASYSLENMKEEVNSDDSRFVITFCSDTIIQVESSGKIQNNRLIKQIENLESLEFINSRRKLAQDLADKEKEEKQAEKNRELFLVNFINYDQHRSLSKVDFLHGGIAYAGLNPNSPRNLKLGDQLLYAKVRGSSLGYIIHTF